MAKRSHASRITARQIERAEFFALRNAEQAQLPVRDGDDSWRTRAACLDLDPDTFMPAGPGRAQEAINVCVSQCPVIKQCQILRRTCPLPSGVWGGAYIPAVPEAAPKTCATEGCARPRQNHRNRWCTECEHGAIVGTPAGHTMHRRRGEPSCPPCRAAENRRQEKYDTRPTVRESASNLPGLAGVGVGAGGTAATLRKHRGLSPRSPR